MVQSTDLVDREPIEPQGDLSNLCAEKLRLGGSLVGGLRGWSGRRLSVSGH
jgi:hypothetical protein